MSKSTKLAICRYTSQTDDNNVLVIAGCMLLCYPKNRIKGGKSKKCRFRERREYCSRTCGRCRTCQTTCNVFGGLHYLSDRDRLFIENWDVESYSRSVATGSSAE